MSSLFEKRIGKEISIPWCRYTDVFDQAVIRRSEERRIGEIGAGDRETEKRTEPRTVRVSFTVVIKFISLSRLRICTHKSITHYDVVHQNSPTG